MMNVQVIADYLRNLHVQRDVAVAAYWLEEAASRSELVSQLSALLSDLPVLIAAVPKGAFDDPNGIIDDLAKTISDNAEWFGEEKRTAITRDEKFSLVLVSKRALDVPQLSSPVTLPDWFPQWPGELLTVTIKSVTDAIDISFASADIPVASINASLHALESALCARLDSVLRRAPTAAASLRARLGGSKGPVDLIQLISQSEEKRRSVAPADFRPGGSASGEYLVSRLFSQWWECSHKDLHRLAVDIAEALDIHTGSKVEAQHSLASLLTRTVRPKLAETPPGVTLARNAIVSLAHAIQFTNAVHHAGDYPNFPAALTISYAKDLSRSCKRAADALSTLA
ncbi:hypothetical protein G8A07_26835 [Roseateles sp. DAIF2]|uniref:hypothetical protein n=1 Tax=Roseateles sp. DAIF2 TaxID=2714952 RepID=UPI0018A30764|nr:hypothetical protein [Roseateles sp. DAIF2]QPF76185.1 hypothetical protein G8A07_26835 [Roseateles sp. DAIF2]